MSQSELFSDFEERLRELLQEEKYLQIINMIEDQGGRFPEQYVYLAYWRVGMAARDGSTDLALQYLDELIEEGIWISRYLLRTSPSFENLQDLVEFDERVQAMGALQRREATQLLPLLTLRRDEEAGKTPTAYPVMLGLHEARGTALNSIKFWQPAAGEGWLVGVPQSTQAQWSGAYVWEDLSTAQKELSNHLRELGETYPLDLRRLILAGHREGGELAAWLPLSGGLQARGFIAVAPAGQQVANPDRWFHMLQASEPQGMRGVFLVGEMDERYQPELKRLVDILNAFDVPTMIEIVPGAGPGYDPAYHEPLLRAIDYILT